jgi:hypothetical protein
MIYVKKIVMETPFGQETLYQPTLDAVIEYLAEKLAAVTAQYAALPAVAQLVEWMLPGARTEWDSLAARGMVYLEVTPESLAGFGLAVHLCDFPHMPPLSAPLDCWGLAMAVAEGLRRGLADPDKVGVHPLYVENALNLAVNHARMTVGLSQRSDC